MELFFYTVIIYPIESIIEFVFLLAWKIFNENAGGAIIIVSLFVNIATLPIYAAAEREQARERLLQKRLKAKVDDIKAVFSGDERYMIISTYYRQNHYHPLYALRGVFPLLIQIPFFIAAYHFLSDLNLLHGASFLFFEDLGKQDALLQIRSQSFNILPIIMTVINMISATIYTKGFSVKEKLQLYVMALLFFVLLYNSPSGLVFYWTLNNLFSLGKNIVAKRRYNKKICYYIGLIGIITLGAFFLLKPHKPVVTMLIIGITAIYILFPFCIKFFKYFVASTSFFKSKKNVNRLFYISIAAFAILLGCVIPSSLIASSVPEFSYTIQYQSPFYLLWITTLQSIGFILFWPIILYLILDEKTKALLSFLSFLVLCLAVLNVFIFQGNYGTLTPFLSFSSDEVLIHSQKEILFNLCILVAACIIIIFFIKSKFSKQCIFVSIILLAAFFSLVSLNTVKIRSEYRSVQELLASDKKNTAENKSEKVYQFSKTHKNVLIFMLDRMPGFFIPSLFEDFPEIAEKFSGFTLYPNTISFGGHTYIGAPLLFGGYEYTPKAIRENSIPNRDMYDEALCVMPRLFSEAAWNTVITDAALANHSWIPDNSIFAPYTGVTALNMEGTYVKEWVQKHNIGMQKKVIPFSETLRNTIRFSFLKASPYFLRKQLYNKGRYLQSRGSVYGLFDFITKAAPLEFIAYELDTNNEENCCNIIVNNLSHTPLSASQARLFCSDEFIQTCEARGKNDITTNHYMSDAYLFKVLGSMMDTLREQGVYDNTRIIFAADHAFGNFILNDSQFNTDFKNKSFQQSYYMPILMVKDFNETGSLHIDMEFRTNGDVPLLATENIISDARNPFTNKAFFETRNIDDIVIANMMEDGALNIYLKDKNIFIEDNWERR